MKTKILILVAIVLIAILGGYTYVKFQNEAFLNFPTYLPDKVKSDPLQKSSRVGNDEFSPIFLEKYYQYFCGEGGNNLTIYQAHKGMGFDYNPISETLKSGMILSFGSVGDKVYYTKDFSLIESKQLYGGKYLFKKYSVANTQYKAYELFWNINKLDLSIQSNNQCLSEGESESELRKIAESMF